MSELTIDSVLRVITNSTVIAGSLLIIAFTYSFNTLWKEDLEKILSRRKKLRQQSQL